jgi:hypothetical protein
MDVLRAVCLERAITQRGDYGPAMGNSGDAPPVFFTDRSHAPASCRWLLSPSPTRLIHRQVKRRRFGAAAPEKYGVGLTSPVFLTVGMAGGGSASTTYIELPGRNQGSSWPKGHAHNVNDARSASKTRSSATATPGLAAWKQRKRSWTPRSRKGAHGARVRPLARGWALGRPRLPALSLFFDGPCHARPSSRSHKRYIPCIVHLW